MTNTGSDPPPERNPYKNVGLIQVLAKFEKLELEIHWSCEVLRHIIRSGIVDPDDNFKINEYFLSWKDREVVKDHGGLVSYANSYPNMADLWVRELKKRFNVKICNFELIQFLKELEDSGKGVDRNLCSGILQAGCDNPCREGSQPSTPRKMKNE